MRYIIEVMKYIGIGLTLLVLALGLGSCTYSAPVEKSMVAVWASDNQTDTPEEPMAYGLVVGDGTQIITAINYEQDISQTLYIGKPGEKLYPVAIQAIDRKNNVTLLKMEKRVFPPADIPKTGDYAWGTKAVIHGWSLADVNKMERREVAFSARNSSNMISGEGPYNDMPGAAVTDSNGDIVGILGYSYTLNYPFSIILGGPGLTGPIVDINDALEILSPDFVGQEWTKQPVFSFITTINEGKAGKPFLPADNKYSQISDYLLSIFETMGRPLVANELPTDYLNFSFSVPENINSTLFTAVYPQPVDLADGSGRVVAQVRWVGIQMNRSDAQPNRLFYGYSGAFTIDGGFIIDGDISTLQKTL
jgi:hypothetical protein